MRRISRFEIKLGNRGDARAAVRLVTDRKLVEYALVLQVRDCRGDWRTVRLYDNAHGEHHVHHYTRTGEKQRPRRFHTGSVSTAYNAAREAVRRDWERMVEEWLR